MSNYSSTQESLSFASPRRRKSDTIPWAEQETSAKDQDHVVLGGVRVNLGEILNGEFLAPKKTRELAEIFRTTRPFPHLVVEGLFSPQLLELVHADFDTLGWSNWIRYDNCQELKRGSLPNSRFGPAAQLYFSTIYSGEFLDFLSRVTGIPGLITDPEFHGGGLHEIPQGGRFSMHVDFNRHPVTRLSNRLVLITYLNRDWLPSYGSALEFWDFDTRERKVTIEPTFGRTALFYQSSKSLHGHPDPVKAPNGRTRRSVTAYFYSNGRADEDAATQPHTTLFPTPVLRSRHDRILNAAKYLLPPVLVDAGRKLRDSLRKD
jgi:Rps23 Pro-64 3,4-dihydroxylase Tpa1-like proline 4-hydroxylase